MSQITSRPAVKAHITPRDQATQTQLAPTPAPGLILELMPGWAEGFYRLELIERRGALLITEFGHNYRHDLEPTRFVIACALRDIARRRQAAHWRVGHAAYSLQTLWRAAKE